MDIGKADFGTVIKFGNLEKFLQKFHAENKQIQEVVDSVDENGISLLEKSLISRKFDIANYLLDKKAKVNIVSKEGFNELHYIAANINFPGAVEVADRLVKMGVDLNVKDKKYSNSAIITLCLEVLKKRTEDGNEFIVSCLKKKPNVHDFNKAGYSLERLIKERGTDEMKKVLEVLS
ncbi:ankyrin repeat domain-containing protein [Sporosarcina cyprini]|uniref:ankyrin repeat domain-containing protein n=1 Tax=Sporosarcina cyprini TaxID=2910523 RepID=UPI001EE12F1F|nr:ankyrin repeat domain-containing protein [Sporosarcina cyprini]MCG3087962.1 ankyrin repeat domain-containing protein [Sporosarcina cyprini]